MKSTTEYHKALISDKLHLFGITTYDYIFPLY